MIYHTEADLHALLDSLTDGEHVKATWKVDQVEVTAEGPVSIDDRGIQCDRYLRWDDGSIANRALTSLEAARDEEVTVTREDEKALHALLDSLENGDAVTAEWRNEHGSMSVTGKVRTSGPRREVDGYSYIVMRRHYGALHSGLHSVTVRRPVMQRWERENNE